MDGHRFIEAAFAKGAVAAIVDRPVDVPHVLVKDTTAALHALAHVCHLACTATPLRAPRSGITSHHIQFPELLRQRSFYSCTCLGLK